LRICFYRRLAIRTLGADRIGEGEAICDGPLAPRMNDVSELAA